METYFHGEVRAGRRGVYPFRSLYSTLIWILWVVSTTQDHRTEASPDARKLYDDLLRKSNYNRLIRPVGNTTDTLTVKLGLRLTQIIDVVSRHIY